MSSVPGWAQPNPRRAGGSCYPLLGFTTHQTNPPPVAPKSPGPTSAAARNAAPVPSSAHALQEGCARDQPLFAGALHTHMTLEWVFRRLVRCQFRPHGENKGTWRRDSE